MVFIVTTTGGMIFAHAQVTIDYKDYYSLAYKTGKNEHIITQSPTEFKNECNSKLAPAYVRFIKAGESGVSLRMPGQRYSLSQNKTLS